jgi:predicted esterase
MQCEQVMYKFRDFDPDEHLVVVPEALNRFYAKGEFGGDVVASWMTSRDRLHEIADFSHYLSQLYESYLSQLPSSCKKIVLGFSQGGTTTFRWLHRQKVEVDVLLGYSCWIPEDIDLAQSVTKLNDLELFYTYGRQDTFINEERVKSLKDVISKNQLNINIIPYDGTHKIDRSHLIELYQLWIQ